MQQKWARTMFGSAAAVVVAVGLGCCTPAQAGTLASNDPTGSAAFAFNGQTQQFTVPDGATELHLVVAGGDGGANSGDGFSHPTVGGRGAQVTADLRVHQGDVLNIAVGGHGLSSWKHADADGGWGASGMNGGDGRSEDDDYRSSGGRGGATLIQLDRVDGDVVTELIAAGGGGDGGSSGSLLHPYGGFAGSDGIRGIDGDTTHEFLAGSHGAGGGLGENSYSGTAGLPAGHGSGLGGDGGGGGGGFFGGGGGGGAAGTSAGGGGGSGASFIGPDVSWPTFQPQAAWWNTGWDVWVPTSDDALNGSVTITW